MTPETWDRLSPFRDKAIAQGIPAEDVERWLSAAARPCATLTLDGDGPVVGEFGGPLLLPADTPDPKHPYLGSVDLAALPADATDLPLPPDGRLLFFAFPESDGYDSQGSVVYLPAGTAVVERDKNAWDPFEWDDNLAMFAKYPQGPMRMTAQVSLPFHEEVVLPGPPLPGPDRSEEFVAVWDGTRDDIAPAGTLQLGGYADEECIDGDPVATAVEWVTHAAQAGHWDGPVSDDVADWVLLADWQAREDVEGWESSSVHFVIQRDDLAARRFDRAYTSVFWNP
ncbi:DUF1963 domain-containing protein [Streptomyces sp. CA-249302]|uniref:DUF1963 domain-containing protein n=1 Tax=Streptomyces sp. CA-249302 TaxID=3240058 RepID=UPI003D8CE953